MRAIVFCLILSSITACSEPEHDPEISAAYDLFVAAIKAGDGGQVYELSVSALHEEMDSLHSDLTATVERIDSEYPAETRDDALESVAAELVRGAKDGRGLFISLLDFEALRPDADAERGLGIGKITRTGDEATVETLGGEVFQFIKEGSDWRCKTALTQLERYPSLRVLKLNRRTAERNMAVWKKAQTGSVDVSKPAGALNVVAAAIQRGARVMIYESLDAPSLKQIQASLPLVKTLQKESAKRFPKAAARQAWLAKEGVAWTERVTDDRSLFAALWSAKLIQTALPSDGEVTFESERSVSEKVTEVTYTSGGKTGTIEFRRTLAGEWKLASLEPLLALEAVRKVDAANKNLTALPPAAP